MLDPIHLKLNLFLFLLLCSEYGAEAQSPVQPTPPIDASFFWDTSISGLVFGAVIAALLLVLFFSTCLRFCAPSSHRDVTEPQCEGGIHPQLLQTFPIFFYSSVIKQIKNGPLQCAVCLTDFNGDDTLRLLPHCNHVFHPPCIDAWLSSHATCPVCRADLNHHHSLHLKISIDDETEAETDARGSPSGEDEGQRQGDKDDKGERERASKSKLSRSNSTGHSLVEDGACMEMFTLRLPEDVKKSIMVNQGVMQRSASYHVVGSSVKGLCWSDSDGSSRGKRYSFGLRGPVTGKNPK